MSDDPYAGIATEEADPYAGIATEEASLDPVSLKTNTAPMKASQPGSEFASLGGPIPAVSQFIQHESSSLAANATAGARTIYDWATGKVKSIGQADTNAQQQVQANTYQPTSPGAKALTSGLESNYNPLNLFGKLLQGGGIGTQYDLEMLGVPSKYSTLLGAGSEAASNVAAGTIGAVRGLGLGKGANAAPSPQSSPVQQQQPQPLSASGTLRAPYSNVGSGPLPPVDSEPVEGGLPKALNPDRTAILQRVGLQNARDSAIAGDAKAAATDWQLSKFDEPAGVAAKTQFDAEEQALLAHAQGIVRDTGGTLGTDEDSLATRGQTIAAPFDALRDHFEQQITQAYQTAAQRANGRPVGTMDGLQSLLKDPDFTETLLAKDQGGLLGSVQRQFTRFQQLNPQGFTVAAAENFRKWLNQTWTQQNSATIGKLKGALDNDVMKGAGEDVYGPAHQSVILERQTLDNPSGIAHLMDVDPENPLNRAVPYEKIPDTLTRLPAAQFDNIIRTLQSMPESIQPQAQAALGEIKAHLANKVYDAGSSTQGQWNAPAVSKVLKTNAAKIQSAFADSPASLQKIQDLDSAGRILKVDQGYPGAAAQAANALKRGLISRSLGKIGTGLGAGVGAVFGPAAAAGASALGGSLGNYAASAIGERQALSNWQRGLTPLRGPGLMGPP